MNYFPFFIKSLPWILMIKNSINGFIHQPPIIKTQNKKDFRETESPLMILLVYKTD